MLPNLPTDQPPLTPARRAAPETPAFYSTAHSRFSAKVENKKQALSMRHIANEANVSVVAVSYALRGLPGVSVTTRQRILAVAESLGYRPDPVLSHLMYHLRSRNVVKSSHNLAMLNWERDSYSRLVMTGVRSEAERLGYPLAIIEMVQPSSSRRVLQRTLYARGIAGLIIGPSAANDLGDLVEWENYAVVTTSYSVLNPRFHRVVPNQFSAAQLAIHTLQSRGYRRIGLIVPPWVEERVNYFHSIALAWESSRENLKPLICYHDPSKQSLEHLRQWCWTNRPDALVLCSPVDCENVLCRALGREAVDRMGIVSLGYDIARANAATIDYQPALLGAIAVEQLISQLHRQERGIPRAQRTLSVEARWTEGAPPAESAIPECPVTAFSPA